MIIPSNDENLLHSTGTAAESPFVIAATRAGIKVVPSIINAVVLTSAWSSGNSGLLTGSRVLYGLALEGRAPKIFKRTSKLGMSRRIAGTCLLDYPKFGTCWRKC